LLAFAGILLAIIIRTVGNFIKKYSGLPQGIAITLGLITSFLLFTAVSFIVAPAVSKQVSQIYTELPEAWEKLNNEVLSFINVAPHTYTAQGIKLPNALINVQNIPSKLGSIFTSTFGYIGNIFIILFFGISLAYQPEAYINGLINLFPKKRQQQVKEILNDTTLTLQYWLAGKALSMFIIGLLTWFGLWFMEMPLAFTLALFAALLSFIPNIGPIISAIPAILLALLKSPIFPVYIILLYLFIQTIESYLITPIIQQKSISMPPALIVFMQLFMSLLAGLLGLTLATPLLAFISVVVRHIYLNDSSSVKK
jgi:predicted PurR-regulated permease PerM